MDVLYTPKNFLDDLMVVLVIYKMEISKSGAFLSLTAALQSANQKTAIFIYDNSPNPQAYIPNENWVITYRNDPRNPGVSTAYNEGFSHAKAQDKRWMLLVDQDTIFENDFFLKSKHAIEDYNQEKIFVPKMTDSKGIVSPFFFHLGRGVRSKGVRTGRLLLAEWKFINSGTLIERDLFEKTGGFDERFKLDFSDLAFLEKLKSEAKTFLVVDSTCTHSLFSSEHRSRRETFERFAIYCHAATLFAKQTSNVLVILWKFLRAIVFFCKYFDYRFLTIAFPK